MEVGGSGARGGPSRLGVIQVVKVDSKQRIRAPRSDTIPKRRLMVSPKIPRDISFLDESKEVLPAKVRQQLYNTNSQGELKSPTPVTNRAMSRAGSPRKSLRESFQARNDRVTSSFSFLAAERFEMVMPPLTPREERSHKTGTSISSVTATPQSQQRREHLEIELRQQRERLRKYNQEQILWRSRNEMGKFGRGTPNTAPSTERSLRNSSCLCGRDNEDHYYSQQRSETHRVSKDALEMNQDGRRRRSQSNGRRQAKSPKIQKWKQKTRCDDARDELAVEETMRVCFRTGRHATSRIRGCVGISADIYQQECSRERSHEGEDILFQGHTVRNSLLPTTTPNELRRSRSKSILSASDAGGDNVDKEDTDALISSPPDLKREVPRPGPPDWIHHSPNDDEWAARQEKEQRKSPEQNSHKSNKLVHEPLTRDQLLRTNGPATIAQEYAEEFTNLRNIRLSMWDRGKPDNSAKQIPASEFFEGLGDSGDIPMQIRDPFSERQDDFDFCGEDFAAKDAINAIMSLQQELSNTRKDLDQTARALREAIRQSSIAQQAATISAEKLFREHVMAEEQLRRERMSNEDLALQIKNLEMRLSLFETQQVKTMSRLRPRSQHNPNNVTSENALSLYPSAVNHSNTPELGDSAANNPKAAIATQTKESATSRRLDRLAAKIPQSRRKILLQKESSLLKPEEWLQRHESENFPRRESSPTSVMDGIRPPRRDSAKGFFTDQGGSAHSRRLSSFSDAEARKNKQERLEAQIRTTRAEVDEFRAQLEQEQEGRNSFELVDSD